jgi:hypothetical protein
MFGAGTEFAKMNFWEKMLKPDTKPDVANGFAFNETLSPTGTGMTPSAGNWSVNTTPAPTQQNVERNMYGDQRIDLKNNGFDFWKIVSGI